jgi:hypothetical protein
MARHTFVTGTFTKDSVCERERSRILTFEERIFCTVQSIKTKVFAV